MALPFQKLPLQPGSAELLLVVAVEHQDDSLILGVLGDHGGDFGAFHEEADVGLVGIFRAGRQIDVLKLGVAILCRSMGKEALFRIGPQNLVECGQPLFAAQLDDSLPATYKLALQKHGQRLVQGLARQVVEPDVHHLLTRTTKVRSELVQMRPRST